jgi:hypothetical protein
MMNNKMMQDCCTCCSMCRTMCLQTMQMCLQKGGKFADAKMNMMLAECAQLCQMTADMAATGSARMSPIAEICAKHCDDCARACDAMNESVLHECAAVLRECAAACRSMKSSMKSAVSA